MKNPEQKHVISTRKPLQNSMNQQTSSEIMPSTEESLENAKRSIGRRKGRRRGKGAKVEQLQDPKLDLSVGSHDSSKGLVFHRRPGYGQLGRKCVVKANHFLAQVPDTDLSQYSVSSLSPKIELQKTFFLQVEGNAGIHLDFENSCNNLNFCSGYHNPRSCFSQNQQIYHGPVGETSQRYWPRDEAPCLWWKTGPLHCWTASICIERVHCETGWRGWGDRDYKVSNPFLFFIFFLM